MKESKFNVFFTHQETIIGYNCLSENYMLFSDVLYEMFKSCVQTDSYEELELIHKEFYDELVKNRFILSDNIDEVDEVIKISRAIDSDESIYQIHINPTMNCNFKCWYCYETHIKDSKIEGELIGTINKVIDKISLNKELKEIHLSWFGGEPLLYFDNVIAPIQKYIFNKAKAKELRFSASITTNGLLVNEKVIDFCRKYSLNAFQITLDGNEEMHDKVRYISKSKGSYRKIVNNIRKLAENNVRVNVRINCSPNTLSGLKEIIEDFKLFTEQEKANISFDFQKVWQDEALMTEDLLNPFRFYFRSFGFKVRGGIYDTMKYSCYADKKNQLLINYNGDVFKCTARDFKKNNREGTLSVEGDILWNENFEKRLSAKFKNKPCLDCKILPFCGGGCSQVAIENENNDYCVHNFDEESKVQAVKNKFLEIIDYY